MPCNVTPMHCITQAPLPWPSVGFVQWEALVGEPRAGGEREDGAFTASLPVFCLSTVLHGCASCQTAPLHLPGPAQVLVKAFSPLTPQCAFVFSLLLSPGYSTGSFMVPRTLSISLVNSLFNSLQLKTFKWHALLLWTSSIPFPKYATKSPSFPPIQTFPSSHPILQEVFPTISTAGNAVVPTARLTSEQKPPALLSLWFYDWLPHHFAHLGQGLSS